MQFLRRAVAFTKGNTAMEVTVLLSPRPRSKYSPAAATTTSATATITPTKYPRERFGTAAVAEIDDELTEAAGSVAETVTLAGGPECSFRFSRARSARTSAAL